MRGTTNRAAFKAYLEGERLFSIISKTDMDRSRKKFEKATDLDPKFARAWGYLSYTYTRAVLAGWLPARQLATAEKHAKKAIALDPDDYAPHWDLAYAYLNGGKFKEAMKEYETALDLYENWTDLLDRKHGLLSEMAEAYVYVGKPQKAIDLLERAKHHPDWYCWNCGFAYYMAGQYDDAIRELDSMRLRPGDAGYVMDVQLFIAAAYAQKGNKTMAQAALKLFQGSRRGRARYTLKDVKKRGCFKYKKDEKHLLDGLRKAGLPAR